MHPFTKFKQEAMSSAPVEAVKRQPDEEAPDLNFLAGVMGEFLLAIESRDEVAMAEAFKAAKQIVDAQPFLDGEHNG